MDQSVKVIYRKSKVIKWILIICIAFLYGGVTTAEAEEPGKGTTEQGEKVTSGYAGEEDYYPPEKKGSKKDIVWTYDATTKTLSFKGKGWIMRNDDGAQIIEGEEDDEAAWDRIGSWYVWWNEAEHLIIGEGIERIGLCDFKYFAKLTDVSFPSTLKSIGDEAFGQSGLTSITIPHTIKRIGDEAFAYSKLEKVTIENGVKEINYDAFKGTNLKTITIPRSVAKLSVGIITNCTSLEKVKILARWKTFPCIFCKGCTSLKKIKIPESVRIIEDGAFYNTSLQTITIPKNVEILGKGASRISGFVFDSSKDLKQVIIKSRKLRKVYPGTFNYFPKKAVIIVPKSCRKQYMKMFYQAGLSKKVKIKGR